MAAMWVVVFYDKKGFNSLIAVPVQQWFTLPVHFCIYIPEVYNPSYIKPPSIWIITRPPSTWSSKNSQVDRKSHTESCKF